MAETKVEKKRNGERGVEVITPFYTHLSADGKPQAILVNRGWMPWDLKEWKFDRYQESSKVQGILY